MLELTKDDLWEGLTVGERKDIDLADFAWPEERKFPIDSQDHLDSCAKLLGHAPEDKQAEIKARAIHIARKHGFTLPDSWQDEKPTTESAMERPAKRIGQLKICWLEYNARSLNGRIYPKSTCDAIYRSGQRKLSDPNGLPITTFVSHETANSNVNTELAGRVTKLWQEGNQFWALIDLADTRAARDMLALAEGGYLKSGSMRVLGVELMHDRNYDVPLVVCSEGIEPDLGGIDLTTRPGLSSIARIAQVLYESNQQETTTEVFALEQISIESREEPPAMTLPIYIQIALGTFQEAVTPDRAAHQRIHDHLAGVMDAAVKECHGNESAGFKALVEAQLDEAGTAIAKKHAVNIAAAHDEAAKACGMTCEGCYKDALGMAPPDAPMVPDTDNDGESHTPLALTESKEDTPLTPEQMLEALKAQGYQIEAPKSDKEKLAEQSAKLAELEAKIMQLAEAAPTQRQTQAAPSQLEESTLEEEKLYAEGDYLESELAPKNWKALANRRVPWPKDMDPKVALHELAPFMTYRLLSNEAKAQGREIGALVGAHEDL